MSEKGDQQGVNVMPDSDKKEIKVSEIHPVILSASRSTDIPAFYSEWFVNRLDAGYAIWVNPFNRNQRQKVFFDTARAIVFWTKNPDPLLKHLPSIDEKIPNYYFQYTLNDYEKEGLEPGLDPLGDRIAVFQKLSDRIGKKRAIWRFDPLILSDELTSDLLLQRIERIAREIHNYTEKLVISFVDIATYKKVERNLGKKSIQYREFTEDEMRSFMDSLLDLLKPYNLEIATCGEKVQHSRIAHNKCIDGELLARLFHEDEILMEYLLSDNREKKGEKKQDEEKQNKTTQFNLFGAPVHKKDSGQREACGCIKSKDIGSYDTCMHLCTYCYANGNENTVRTNYDKYKETEGKSEAILPLKD